jgi:hypothetical protein
MSFQALRKFNPGGPWIMIPRNPSPSNCLACSIGPTSMARRPSSRTSCATVSLASPSSPAMSTSSGHDLTTWCLAVKRVKVPPFWVSRFMCSAAQ